MLVEDRLGDISDPSLPDRGPNLEQKVIENVIKHNRNLVTVLFGANYVAFHKMIDLENKTE